MLFISAVFIMLHVFDVHKLPLWQLRNIELYLLH